MSRPLPLGPERRARLRPPRLAPTALLALLLLIAAPARAQVPQHRLDAVFPAGGQLGQEAEVQLVGGELESVEGLWFDHPGIRAARAGGDATPPRFRVSIAPDVPPGLHDVRAVGPLGVSNPRAFAVGLRPEEAEREPNNGPDEAGPVEVGRTVNGRIDGATDVDWFSFEGKADRRVLVTLLASRLDAPLDAEIRLFDAEGRELAYGHDDVGRDPRLDCVLPADGTYRVEVRDVVYSGSPAHVYRLGLLDGPVVDAVVPRAAEPGSMTAFTLLGRDLGEGATSTGDILPGGRPLERLEVSIPVPADLAIDPDRPGAGYSGSPGAGVRGFWHVHEAGGGAADPVFIAEALAPVVVEEEPSGEGADEAAMPLSPPCDVSADFRRVGDVDLYEFRAAKGETWMIEVFAERIGSPVDTTLLVQQLGEDGGVARDVAEADDQGDPGTAPRFPRATVDPALKFQAPEDATYRITVGDLYNAAEPAPGAVYRLVIRPERPDFLLFAAPGDAGGPAAVSVRAGGRTNAQVLVHRRDGLAGPIRVEAEGLPAGVSAEPVVIGANQAQAPIVFSASEGAPTKLGTARLVGIPIGADGAPTGGPGRVALAGSITLPPAGGRDPTPVARVTRGLAVAVLPGAPARLSAAPGELTVPQGGSAELTATVSRAEGVEAEFQVTADALPDRVTATEAKVEQGKDSAPITITVPDDAEPGPYTLLLRAVGKASIPDPNDPSKAREVTLSEPSNPIRLTITKK
ncbi:PPC domain-containing protein [Tautonia plasticadhaerens]|uniref:Putative subtilase-type serine protease n=1 Tax=Tautonia plasticadhaerens TaxID=2527974 RepID=A0A518H2V9_9BACT|nr:PPC domain-containing protein [Tautonia plasticadhaerens]QDV35163.1 putative subtilase-type serine protease precursor [Tautonia plasticadhaerens]